MKVSMKKSGLIIFLGFTLLLGNSYARRVKESLLYAPTFYQEQFNYLGYSKNKAIERTLKKIAQELGIGNVDEWVQQHLSSLKAKIDVSSISFEKIRSRVYQGLETLGVDLTELYEKWKEEAQNAIEVASKFIDFVGKLNNEDLFKLLLRSDCELSWFEEGRLDSLLGTEEIEDHDVFNADYEAFKKRINDAVKEGGTIVVIPGTVQGLVVDMFVFGKLLEQYNSAAKVKFLVRSKRMEHFPTEVDFDKVKGELGISDNVEKIVVELDSPGCHLDELSENVKTINEIKKADLLVIKGPTNAVTTQYINKEHFLAGVVDKTPQSQHYTGLDWKDEKNPPPAYVAYVPRGIAVSVQYDKDRATVQNLSQFVRVDVETRKELEEKGCLEINGQEVTIGRINRSGAGFVLWANPEALGEEEGVPYFKRVRNELLQDDNLTLEEAVERALQNIGRGDAFINHPLEVNKVYNGEKLKGALGESGEYNRFAYGFDDVEEVSPQDPKKVIDMENYGNFGRENRTIGNMIILPEKNNVIGLITSEFDGRLLEPVERFVEEAKGQVQQGVIINGAYFMTEDGIEKRFNDFNVGYKVPESLIGEYLGFLVKGKKVFIPLYNKGALIKWKNGGLSMARVELTAGGKIERIGDIEVNLTPDAVNSENPGEKDVVIYTPMFEKMGRNPKDLKRAILKVIGEMKGNANVSEKKQLDALEVKINKLGSEFKYNSLYSIIDPYASGVDDVGRKIRKELIKELTTYGGFQVRVPKREEAINIVVVGDTVVHISEQGEETIIPPFGYVISIPDSKLRNIDINVNELKGERIVYRPKIKVNGEEKDLSEIEWAMGGVTLLYSEDYQIYDRNTSVKEWLRLQNEVMQEEGWNLISSRRTQDTDFALIDDRGPRQVLGKVRKDGNEYLVVFTISGRTEYSKGCGFGELLYMINQELPRGYKLVSLLNFDGGSSVNTNYFVWENNKPKLYTINIPGPGPNSKANHRRDLNSVIIIGF